MSRIGTVYLIHFETPYKGVQHYIGWASRVNDRFAHHQNGTGANLLKYVNAAGIPYRIVRKWKAGKVWERQLKNMKCAKLLCPCCSGRKKAYKRARLEPIKIKYVSPHFSIQA